MMETQILIQEIQKRHQITLKPEDPIFVAVTLNDLLLSHYLERFQAMLEAQNKLVVSGGIERLNQASAMGSEMINRSLEALSQTLDDTAAKFAQQLFYLHEQKEPKQAQNLQEMEKVRRLVFCSFIACSSFVLGIIFIKVFS